jgi:hypothetical protein
MADRARNYQRLTGRNYGGAGIATLWLGEGYLLQVGSMILAERYRRWYLREVQAIVMRRSSKRLAWNLVWGLLSGMALAATAGFSGLAVAGEMPREGRIFLWVFAGIAGAFGLVGMLLVLINSWLGPTCVVFVQTPDGVHPLAAPTRQRSADALIARLRPLIETAQPPMARTS